MTPANRPAAAGFQDEITGFWQTRGGEYDSQPRHGILDPREREVWLTALRELLPAPPAQVLDVGTGTGFLALLIAGLGYRVTGVDLSDGMMATARAAADGLDPAPVFGLGDAIDPPFADATFDVVTNRHVLWTLLDPARAFARWHALLRPGGRLVAIDSLWEQERQTSPEPPRAHTGYSEQVTAALPLRNLTSVDPVLGIARAAGFSGARIVMLEDVTRIEREVLPPGTREFGDRYAVVGTKA